MSAVKTGVLFFLAFPGMFFMFGAAMYANGRELIQRVGDPGSIMSRVWRLFVALMDWHTHLRFLGAGRGGRLDAVLIANMRDSIDRACFLGGWHPPEGHFNGPRYSIHGILGRTRILDVTAGNLATPDGRRQAREQFVLATRRAELYVGWHKKDQMEVTHEEEQSDVSGWLDVLSGGVRLHHIGNGKRFFLPTGVSHRNR